MKKTIMSLTLALFTLGSQAQESKQELEACIFEGMVTGVPDRSIIAIFDQEGKFGMGAYPDSVMNQRFRFEYSPKTLTQHFAIELKDFSSLPLKVYAYPGSKTTITGDGVFCYFWKAENDNPLQKELNEYIEFEKTKFPEKCELLRKIFMLRTKANVADLPNEEKERLRKDEDSLRVLMSGFDSDYVEVMLGFMKGRECNEIWLDYLYDLAHRVVASGDVVQKEKVRKLYETIPSELRDLGNAIEVKNIVYPPNVLKIGDQMADFTLYDLEGNEHRLSEVKDKITILEFCSNGCGPCYFMRPQLEEFVKNYAEKVELITISMDAKNVWLRQVWGKTSWSEWNDYKDAADIRAKYGVECLPTFIFISPDKKIIAKCDNRDFFEMVDKYIAK